MNQKFAMVWSSRSSTEPRRFLALECSPDITHTVLEVALHVSHSLLTSPDKINLGRVVTIDFLQERAITSVQCQQCKMKDHHKDSQEDEESLVESIDIHDDRKLEEN
uniref:Uncharacterized protein n=1 Tax=Timema poppense TaxID=170557 RepID=A0A7R9DU94_TIMPO|nr:unnamed protein product [Timema poppensis]